MLFLSGAGSLIDEHLLSRLLGRVLGSSAEAVACVLVAFMGGMGLGAHLTRRRLLRQSASGSLRSYALVEGAVAVSALALPAVLSSFVRVYASVARAIDAQGPLLVVRFVIAVVVCALPGVLMGATLPLAVDGAARMTRARPPPLARFYAGNTLGAALGVFASTYFLIPSLGIRETLVFAAGCNAFAGLAALALMKLSAGERDATAPSDAPVEAAGAEGGADELPMSRALIIAFGSGAFAFAFEVLWFRLLAVVVGNSVYAFGLMLFVFLLGNGLGSRVAAAPLHPRALALAVAQALVGTAAVAVMPLWDDMPPLFQRVGAMAPSFVLWEGTRLFAAAVLIGPPTLAMGCAFGLLLRIAGGRGSGAGARVARLYSANVIGAVIAVPLTTFVLAPGLGSQLSFVLVALAEIGVAWLALVPSVAASRRRLPIAAGLALPALVLLALGSPWNVATLMSGSNVYFSEGFARYDELLRLREDRAGGMVAVVESQKVKTLIANGKFEGNDGFEVPEQQMFALLPLLFVRKHGAALNIGVGTANTLSVIGKFPFARIDAVDISSAVIDAARAEFGKLNDGVLDDPRVHVQIDDGRNFLLRTRVRYDLVTVQLSSIWIGGVADLYNLEFYESLKDRLTEEGVFKQWIQLHHIATRDVAGIVATARKVFPHLTLWVAGHQALLVGSMTPLRADAAALRGWRSDPGIRATLKTSGLEHPFEAFGHLYMGTEGLDAFVAEVAEHDGITADGLVSRDDTATLEYSTPRGNLLADAVGDNMEALRRHSDALVDRYVDNIADDAERRLLLAYAARARGFLRIAARLLAPARDRIPRAGNEGLFDQIDDARRRNAGLP
jgi:spermidine synthase